LVLVLATSPILGQRTPSGPAPGRGAETTAVNILP
jgi:hypothetical protein